MILNDGSNNKIFLNGVVDTDTDNNIWLDNQAANYDNISIGAVLRSSGGGDLFGIGKVAFVGYLPYTDDATIIALQNELKTIFGI